MAIPKNTPNSNTANLTAPLQSLFSISKVLKYILGCEKAKQVLTSSQF